MKNFEARLEKLEELGEKVRSAEIPLDEAIVAFEEGIKLARSLEKDLEKAENRIDELLNPAEDGAEKEPLFTLFDSGTKNEPSY